MEVELAIVCQADVQALSETLKKIEGFQGLIRSQLAEGQDYGVIPGCGTKPTLLKPGAEKITMLLGLRSRYEIVREEERFEDGFFFYLVKASLISSAGEIVAEGLGSCNTMESRFRKRDGSWKDPYSGANVALKMARKRALVDAALTVGSLSNLFTQDIEDMDLDTPRRRSNTPVPPAEISQCSEAQRKKIFAASRAKDLPDDVLKAHMQKHYGTDTTRSLSRAQASDLIDWIESGGTVVMPGVEIAS